MKKFLTIAVILVSFAISASASGNEKVSNKAAAHLAANYSAAKDVSWTVTDNFEKASFTAGNEKVTVFYDAYGELLGSTKTMAFDKLPKSALEILTADYTFPDFQLTDCIEYTDTDNNKSYYVSFEINDERIILSISTGGFITQM
jgi:hypothetical protein